MYENNTRGAIKYPDRYKQAKLISYQGMVRLRKITPTDIDGLIDYNGNAFVYMEGKLENKELDYGQRLALENIVKSHKKANNISRVFVFRYNEPPDIIVVAKDKLVSEVYDSETLMWNKPKQEITLLEAIKEFEDYCLLNNISI